MLLLLEVRLDIPTSGESVRAKLLGYLGLKPSMVGTRSMFNRWKNMGGMKACNMRAAMTTGRATKPDGLEGSSTGTSSIGGSGEVDASTVSLTGSASVSMPFDSTTGSTVVA